MSALSNFRPVALLLAVVLLVTGVITGPVVPFVSQARAAEGDTDRLNMKLTTLEHLQNNDVPERWEYWSGETIKPHAGFEISGTDVNVPNAVATVRVKKSPYIKAPKFSDSIKADSSDYREDADYWYMDYAYNPLNGGRELGVPFTFNFENKITPNGATTEIAFTLYDGNKNVIHEISRTVTAKATQEYQPQKIAMNCAGAYNHANIVIDGKNTRQCWYRKDNPQSYTKVETLGAGGVTTIAYDFRLNYIPAAGAAAGQGEYLAKSVRYVDTLPAGVRLSQRSINEGWSYVDATQRQIQRTVPIDQTGKNQCVGCTNLFLEVFDANINKDGTATRDPQRLDNTVRAFLNPADDNTEIGTSTASHAFRVDEVPPPPPPPVFEGRRHNVSMDKWFVKDSYNHTFFHDAFYQENNGTISQPMREHIPYRAPFRMGYSMVVTQTNNGSAVGDVKRGGITDYLHEIVDKDLDEGLTFGETSVLLLRRPGLWMTEAELRARFNASQPVLYGITADGTKEKIADLQIASGLQTPLYPISDTNRKYVKAKIEFPTPLEMDNFEVQWLMDIFPSEAERQKWMAGGYANVNDRRTYENWMEARLTNAVTGEDSSPGQESYLTNNRFDISAVAPKMTSSMSGNTTVVYKKCSEDLDSLVPYDPKTKTGCEGVREYTVSAESRGTWAGYREPLKNFRQIILLPSGVEYIRPTSTSANTHVGIDAEPRQPKIVPNFKNTGKTAVIFEYGDVTPNEAGRLRVETKLHLYTTVYADAGTPNRIIQYTTYDNEKVLPESNAKDELDIDQDGNIAEKILMNSVTTTLLPPAELATRKNVSNDGKSWFLNAPAQDLGKEVYYRLEVRNMRFTPINRISVLDVLPNLADKKIVENQQGEYLSRKWDRTSESGDLEKVEHSAFETPLSGPIHAVQAQVDGSQTVTDAMERFDFYYSTVAQDATSTLATIRDGQWLTEDQVSDWSKVKNFKAVLKEGQTIQSKETIHFITKHTIPYTEANKQLAAGTRAVNSFAYSTNDFSYNETNEVSAEITKYTVDGIAFADLDLDGNARVDEKRLPGYTARLIDADTGQQATNPDGSVISDVMTDQNGYYSFTVYTRGNYRVLFTKKQSEAFTVPGTGKRDVANHVTSCGTALADVTAENCTVEHAGNNHFGATDVFTLSPVNHHEIRNVGVRSTIRDFMVKKVDQDGNILSGITFELEWLGAADGFPAPANAPAVETQQTDAQGLLTFEDKPLGRYRLSEKNVPEGIQGIDPREIVLTSAPYATDPQSGAALKEYSVTNNVIKANVTVKKIDAETNAPLSGAVFTLTNKKDGTKTYTSTTTGEDGIATFTDVLYGDYTLTETTAPANYNRSTEQKTVQVRTHQETVEVGNFADTIFKGTIKVKKIDADTNAVIPGATFGLFTVGQDGNRVEPAIATKQSNPDGLVTFENVSFGTYKIAEITPATGYLATNIVKDATITAQGQVVDLTNDPFTNTIKKSNVQLKKIDSRTKAVLSGVDFTLYPTNGATVDEDHPIGPVTTNNDGLAVFENVRYGTYVLRETKALAGYAPLSSDIPVNVTGDEATLDLGTRENVKILGTVKVAKVDDSTPAKPLEGVTFALFAKNADGEPATEASFTAQTNADGLATFSNVPAGSYLLKETETIAGYNRNTLFAPEVVIERDGQVVDFTASSVVNPRIRGKVEVTKQDAKGNVLSGVIFSLFPKKADGTPEEAAAYTATTNENGTATFEGVLYGDYILKETTPKIGFNPSTEVNGRPIEVRQEGVIVSAGAAFVNKVITSTVTVTKVDADTPAMKLGGVKFGLFPKVDGVVSVSPAYEATTAPETGIATFADVEYGDYVLREITPLINYVKSDVERDVLVRTEGETITLDQYTNTLKKGTVVLRKVDVDNQSIPVAGVKFALKQGDEIKYEATSTATGDVVFNDVVYGEYVATEIEVPQNYTLNTLWNENVNVTADKQVIDLKTVTNRQKKSTLRATKFSADDNSPLEGAEFALKQGDTVLRRTASDENGVVTFENVNYGDYTLVEITAPKGYVLDPTHREVQVREDGATVDLGRIDNHAIRGEISLTKVDATTKEALAGVEFELVNADGNVVDTRATTDEGKVTFTRVRYGSYTVREKAPLEGYNPLGKNFDVTIDTDGQKVDLGTAENRKISGNIVVKKVDEESNEPLKGVTFALYPAPATNATAPAEAEQPEANLEAGTKAVDLTAQPAYEAATDETGTATFEGVLYGKWILVERAPIEGYNPSAETAGRLITVDTDGATVDAGKPFTNAKIRADITLTKVNRAGKALVGARFELRDAQGEAIAHAVSDENGLVTFPRVAYGTYTVAETKAPSGYYRSNEVREATVSVEGQTVDLGQFVNTLIYIPTPPPVEPQPEKPVAPQPPAPPVEPVTPVNPKAAGKGFFGKVLAQTGADTGVLGSALMLAFTGAAILGLNRRRQR